MIDFEEARLKMVDCQVRTCDVTDHAIISAMMQVPREEFVPEDMRELAYIDEDISLDKLGGNSRYVMEAAPFAKMMQLADIQKEDIILTIGGGSGYCLAVLSLLGTSVVAVEENDKLAAFASKALTRLGYDNVVVLNANPYEGCVKEAPFDVIFIDGAVGVVPETLMEQLAEGGRLVVVEGEGNSAVAKTYCKDNGVVSSRIATNLAIKPLPGFAAEAEFTF